MPETSERIKKYGVLILSYGHYKQRMNNPPLYATIYRNLIDVTVCAGS